MAVTIVNLPRPIEEAVGSALADAPLETLVAGAGDLPTGPFLDISQADWDASVDAMTGAFRAARDAAAGMLARGVPGRIVLLSSAATQRPVQGASLAATAGGFLTRAAQVAAAELGSHRVTANVVVPGFLEDERFVDGIPAGRLPEPHEIASVVAFLASEAAGYVNGAVITVDGGFTITKTGGGSPLVR